MIFRLTLLAVLLATTASASAQVTLTGRTWTDRYPGADDKFAFTTITGFANRPGPDNQSLSCRTWETYPSGWYHFEGNAGPYTMVLSNPAHFMRPVLRTNLFLEHGQTLEKNLAPEFDYALFDERAWDEQPAAHYFQSFTARGNSITHVGFKLATDGVDGEGPLSQDLQVSIHKQGDGTPDTWEQVGPAMPVLNVNCGGALSRTWSAGWNSGEVPTAPGETYAVHLQAQSATGTFQAFWSADDLADGRCYRVGADSEGGWVDNDLWMTVAGDSDGLVIPYNKRVHAEHHELAGWSSRWTQTWVAQGESLASLILYVAVSTEQPVLMRQRAIVQIREDGDGKLIYPPKVAKGQSTATAESGVFGVTFAPGELDLEPGRTYAAEFIGLGEGSGFNPWLKYAPDTYPDGRAWMGEEETDGDLDMQVIEYRDEHHNMARAVEPANLLTNGNFNEGTLDPEDEDQSRPENWQRFVLDPGTKFWYPTREDIPNDFYIKVIGGAVSGTTVDGGYVQQVTGLSSAETYRLAGKVRSTFAVDNKHQAFVGIDPTGQTEDAEADSIRWDVVPDIHGLWLEYAGEPVRPATDTVSVWLRGHTTEPRAGTFEADFDDFALQQVKATVE